MNQGSAGFDDFIIFYHEFSRFDDFQYIPSRNYIRFDEFKFVHLYDLFISSPFFWGFLNSKRSKIWGFLTWQEVGYAKAPNYED